MKRILIFTVLFSLGISAFAQEYYYWANGRKISLELDPTRKYISVHSADDTLALNALKNKLIEQNIQVFSYPVRRLGNFSFYGVLVESDNLPNFIEDEIIAYEGGFFLEKTGFDHGPLTEVFYVVLKNSDDLPDLQEFAKENNVTIAGRSRDMPFEYYLFCTKASAGSPMQMANLCYESGLSDEVYVSIYGADADGAGPPIEPLPTSITLPATKPAINLYRESGSSIVIEAAGDLIKEVEVFDLSGKILHKSSYSDTSRVKWTANQRGLYIVKINLQSGNSVHRKIII
jgi:hypothetical protein